MIHDDFEMDSQKDLVYLLEAKAIMEKEYWDWYNSKERLPAKIEIIDESKLKEDGKAEESQVLPF